MLIGPDKYIEITPGVRGKRPCLTATRITVADIVLMNLRLDLSLEEISVKYNLPLAAVYAAMAYYHGHRTEIDDSIENDKSFAEAFKHNNSSPLQEKRRQPPGC